MSTFYVLPPRPLLGECFADYLKNTLPGLEVVNRIELIESFCTAVSRRNDVFVVFREDLPKGEDLVRAVIDGYGAEPGDEIVEVKSTTERGQTMALRQCVPAAA